LRRSSGGVFEISFEDQLVYSKRATGQFPGEKAILNKVQEWLEKD